jgi:hypothetical protein
MNFNAFRDIATATQKVVQYAPTQAATLSARWTDLGNAYMKLITPTTRIVLSHDMITEAGEVKFQGEVTWPNLTAAMIKSPTLDAYLQQAHYHVNALFPSGYIDAFLDRLQATTTLPATPNNPAMPIALNSPPPFEVQAGQFVQYAITQGYLKKMGDAYVLNLVGNGSTVTINGVPWKAPT